MAKREQFLIQTKLMCGYRNVRIPFHCLPIEIICTFKPMNFHFMWRILNRIWIDLFPEASKLLWTLKIVIAFHSTIYHFGMFWRVSIFLVVLYYIKSRFYMYKSLINESVNVWIDSGFWTLFLNARFDSNALNVLRLSVYLYKWSFHKIQTNLNFQIVSLELNAFENIWPVQCVPICYMRNEALNRIEIPIEKS